MPNYSLRIPGGEVETEYTLEPNNDGTFSMSIYVWDTMAGAASSSLPDDGRGATTRC